jgi:hypothetical protein
MTSRSYSKITDASNYEVSSAVGQDGKYEVVNGRRRLRWNQYTRLYSKHVGSKSNWFDPNTGITWNEFAPIGTVPPWSTLLNGNDYNSVLAKLASKVRDHDFNLAVNLAQGKQAYEMILGNLVLFGRAAIAARHGDFPKAIRALKASPRDKKRFHSKDISGRWLELQYGWLPLVSDSYEAFKAFTESNQWRAEVVRVSGRKTGTFDSSASPSNYTGVAKWDARYIIRYEMSEALSFPRSLGLSDPLSVVWEVLPWSFVIDWFFPVGTYLDNLSIIPFLRGRFQDSLSIKTESKLLLKTTPNRYTGATSFMKRYELIRNPVSTSFSVPLPSFKPIDKALSPKRLYNAIALAHQRFKA